MPISQACTFNDIPDELLTLIADKLQAPDLCAFAATSKRCKQVANDVLNTVMVTNQGESIIRKRTEQEKLDKKYELKSAYYPEPHPILISYISFPHLFSFKRVGLFRSKTTFQDLIDRDQPNVKNYLFKLSIYKADNKTEIPVKLSDVVASKCNPNYPFSRKNRDILYVRKISKWDVYPYKFLPRIVNIALRLTLAAIVVLGYGTLLYPIPLIPLYMSNMPTLLTLTVSITYSVIVLLGFHHACKNLFYINKLFRE